MIMCMNRKSALYRYIGKSKVAFENGSMYEARKETDEMLGECYAVVDESDEEYLYSVSFFKSNFVKIE